jgi:hypothetical protein
LKKLKKLLMILNLKHLLRINPLLKLKKQLLVSLILSSPHKLPKTTEKSQK